MVRVKCKTSFISCLHRPYPFYSVLLIRDFGLFLLVLCALTACPASPTAMVLD